MRPRCGHSADVCMCTKIAPLPLLRKHYLSILKMIVKILEIGYPAALGKQHKWLIVLDIRRNLITSQDRVMLVFLNLHLHLPLRSRFCKRQEHRNVK